MLTPCTVLIIDDDKDIRDFLSTAFTLYGYQVVTAATVQEAEATRQCPNGAPVGLVIADVHLTNRLEERAGYRLFERWTATAPVLPFLLISGDPDSKALPAIRTGAVPFLAKPFVLAELLHTVRTLLARIIHEGETRSWDSLHSVL
jgi:DNA-binding NtrC family response regulator